MKQERCSGIITRIHINPTAKYLNLFKQQTELSPITVKDSSFKGHSTVKEKENYDSVTM